MKATFQIFVIGLAVAANSIQAQSSETWQLIENPNEISELIKGKALGGKDWIFYFRSDGKVASMQYDSITVREWSITQSGKVCYAVFSMPDKIIRCETIENTNSSPQRYRMVNEYGVFEFEVKNPPTDLVNAIVEKAGPD